MAGVGRGRRPVGAAHASRSSDLRTSRRRSRDRDLVRRSRSRAHGCRCRVGAGATRPLRGRRCSRTRADALGRHVGDSTQRDLGERRASTQERARDIRRIRGRGVVPRHGTSAGALRNSFGRSHAVRRRAGPRRKDPLADRSSWRRARADRRSGPRHRGSSSCRLDARAGLPSSALHAGADRAGGQRRKDDPGRRSQVVRTRLPGRSGADPVRTSRDRSTAHGRRGTGGGLEPALRRERDRRIPMRRRSRYWLRASAVRRSSVRACTSGSANPALGSTESCGLLRAFSRTTSRARRRRSAPKLLRPSARTRRSSGVVAISASSSRARPHPRSWHPASKPPSTTSRPCATQSRTAACRSWPTCRTRPEARASNGYGALGLRSSFRVPIAIGAGEAELILIVSWTKEISEPDPSTVVLLRRFADQAGFALEQIERRRAQAEAAKRADETRRLQEVTAALSLASTSTEVTDTCLTHVLEAVEAEAGFVVLSRPEGVTVDFVSSSGYSDDELRHWGTFALDSNVPFARAIAAGEPVWALTRAEMAGFDVGELQDQGWVSIPLRTAAGVRGALHVSFRRPRELSDDERRWLQVGRLAVRAGARTQSALRRRARSAPALGPAPAHDGRAVERSHARGRREGRRRRDRRRRSARPRAALGIVLEERRLVQLLAWVGYSDESVESRREVSLDEPTPGNRAVKRRVSSFYESLEDVRLAVPGVSEVMELAEHESFLYVPLVAGRRANGLLVMSWAEPLRTVLRGAAIRRSARGSGRPGARPRERFRVRAVDRGDPPAERPARLAASRRGHAARRSLPAGHGRGRGRRRLVRCDSAPGRTARARRGRRRRQGRAGGRDHGAAPERLARVLARPDEAVVHAHPPQPPRRGDHGDGVRDRGLRGHRRGTPGSAATRRPAIHRPWSLFPDRRIEFLEGGRGLPLGAGTDTRYTQEIVELPVGTTVVLVFGRSRRAARRVDRRRTRAPPLGRSRRPDASRSSSSSTCCSGWSVPRDEVTTSRCWRCGCSRSRRSRSHLRLPSDVASLDLVRDAMRSWLAGAPVSGSDAHDIVLAVWEACANAIEHAVDPREDTLEVRAELDRLPSSRIAVEDTGTWSPPVDTPNRGFGLRLMRGCDDLGRDRPREHGDASDAREVPRRSRRTRWLEVS